MLELIEGLIVVESRTVRATGPISVGAGLSNVQVVSANIELPYLIAQIMFRCEDDATADDLTLHLSHNRGRLPGWESINGYETFFNPILEVGVKMGQAGSFAIHASNANVAAQRVSATARLLLLMNPGAMPVKEVLRRKAVINALPSDYSNWVKAALAAGAAVVGSKYGVPL